MPNAIDVVIAQITARIGENFRCFGAGSVTVDSNPIALALKDRPLQFAAGVDVAEVVRFVLADICQKEE